MSFSSSATLAARLVDPLCHRGSCPFGLPSFSLSDSVLYAPSKARLILRSGLAKHVPSLQCPQDFYNILVMSYMITSTAPNLIGATQATDPMTQLYVADKQYSNTVMIF